jgi:hypothetical protein
MVCALIGSFAVASSVGFALPEEDLMNANVDPRFDSAAFYRSLPERAGRSGGRAMLPGQPLRPGPVVGLNQAQTDNAYIIVEVGRQMGLPRQAHVVAVATALQETNLRNLANPKVPSSLKLKNEGTGTNYDSLGLFQQRPSMGWGTVAQLMDPAHSSARFYAKLMRVGGWQSMSVSAAAQAVQRSAFPSAYQKHADRAGRIVDAVSG